MTFCFFFLLNLFSSFSFVPELVCEKKGEEICKHIVEELPLCKDKETLITYFRTLEKILVNQGVDYLSFPILLPYFVLSFLNNNPFLLHFTLIIHLSSSSPFPLLFTSPSLSSPPSPSPHLLHLPLLITSPSLFTSLSLLPLLPPQRGCVRGCTAGWSPPPRGSSRTTGS